MRMWRREERWWEGIREAQFRKQRAPLKSKMLEV
jgi:hypothetical protein